MALVLKQYSEMKQSKDILIFISVLLPEIVSSLSRVDDSKQIRHKRGILQFPINSATGILIAIAVPLDLPERNIFVSYNFEANYNMPTKPTDVFPGPLERLDFPGVTTTASSRQLNGNVPINHTLDTTDRSILLGDDITTIEPVTDAVIDIKPTSKLKRSLFSRKKVYKVLESKITE